MLRNNLPLAHRLKRLVLNDQVEHISVGIEMSVHEPRAPWKPILSRLKPDIRIVLKQKEKDRRRDTNPSKPVVRFQFDVLGDVTHNSAPWIFARKFSTSRSWAR
jgi:hypothetical protein